MNKQTITTALLALIEIVAGTGTVPATTRPCDYYGKIAIVVSNALIFYAAHVGTGVWRLDTLIMAVILCLMYMRTRDVRYCVITHVTCNLMGIFSAYYFV